MNLLTADIDCLSLYKEGHKEGFGSVFQLVLNIVACVYHLNDNKKITNDLNQLNNYDPTNSDPTNKQFKYLFKTLKNIGHKEKDKTQEEWDKMWNDYILKLIPKDILQTEINNNDIVYDIKDYKNKLILDNYIDQMYDRLSLSYSLIDQKCFFKDNETNISIHIRNFNNNDVCLNEEREYLNKSTYIKDYYIKLINFICVNKNDIVDHKENKLHFHIFSQGDEKEFQELVDLIIKNNSLITLHLNEDQISTLHHLIKSDILILAKSSFSAIANYYSRGKNIILEAFWHKLNPNTLFSNRDGEFVINDNKLELKDNYIDIPDDVKNIKISIGESYNAPYSALWLRQLPDRMVFGFEPNPKSVKLILSGNCVNLHFPDRLRMNVKYINNKRYVLIPCALDELKIPGITETRKFYSTKNDIGCSSLLQPQHFLCEEIKVNCMDFYSFLSLIPPRFKYIEHVKIDAQGCDFRIIKSAKDLIKKIVFLTVKCGNEKNEYICDQKDTGHTQEQLEKYLGEMNFKLLPSTPLYANNEKILNIVKYGICQPNITFVNLNYLEESKNLDCSLLIE